MSQKELAASERDQRMDQSGNGVRQIRDVPEPDGQNLNRDILGADEVKKMIRFWRLNMSAPRGHSMRCCCFCIGKGHN